MKSFNNEEILRKLSNLNIDLIVTVLGSSVGKEAKIDSKLVSNPEKQKRGTGTIFVWSNPACQSFSVGGYTLRPPSFSKLSAGRHPGGD